MKRFSEILHIIVADGDTDEDVEVAKQRAKIARAKEVDAFGAGGAERMKINRRVLRARGDARVVFVVTADWYRE